MVRINKGRLKNKLFKPVPDLTDPKTAFTVFSRWLEENTTDQETEMDLRSQLGWCAGNATELLKEAKEGKKIVVILSDNRNCTPDSREFCLYQANREE